MNFRLSSLLLLSAVGVSSEGTTDITDRTNSKQKGGTVAKVTKGMIDRTAYYEHALHLALVPFVHDESTPGLYRDT